tara:strand:- start:9539 stop:9982 length:444 start_codon:yes stop_codon:yes gene_type:complete
MNYYNTHLTKTRDPKHITKNKLERGMVVKLRYKKEDGIKYYMVLVLQPSWENKLHALSFNNIPPQKVLSIAEGYDEVLSESIRVRKLGLTKIDINKDSKEFYTTEIKKDKNLKVGYRTFNLDKIKSLTVVNYDWGIYDKIPPKSERK